MLVIFPKEFSYSAVTSHYVCVNKHHTFSQLVHIMAMAPDTTYNLKPSKRTFLFYKL